MKRTHGVRRVAVSMNGIGVAYLMGVVNAGMVTVAAFGVDLNETQRVAVASFVNASLILGIHLAHRIGEVAAAGGSGAMSRAQTRAVVDEAMPTPSEPTG